jgi:zinc/manganese transport system ATP-binding protein
VGLEGLEWRPIETLSTGQLQRVLFARLIAQDAELILLDEPLSAVDWRTSEDLLRVIVDWHKEGGTVAAVLHDLDQARSHFPESILIARECVASGATPQVPTPQNLRRAREISATWTAEARDWRRASQMPALTSP